MYMKCLFVLQYWLQFSSHVAIRLVCCVDFLSRVTSEQSAKPVEKTANKSSENPGEALHLLFFVVVVVLFHPLVMYVIVVLQLQVALRWESSGASKKCLDWTLSKTSVYSKASTFYFI